MKLLFAFFLLSLLSCTLARPQYKDIDYKLYSDDSGVAVDAIYEVISDKPPDSESSGKHHHHHHHKKMMKTNRLDRLKRYLNDRL